MGGSCSRHLTPLSVTVVGTVPYDNDTVKVNVRSPNGQTHEIPSWGAFDSATMPTLRPGQRVTVFADKNGVPSVIDAFRTGSGRFADGSQLCESSRSVSRLQLTLCTMSCLAPSAVACVLGVAPGLMSSALAIALCFVMCCLMNGAMTSWFARYVHDEEYGYGPRVVSDPIFKNL